MLYSFLHTEVLLSLGMREITWPFQALAHYSRCHAAVGMRANTSSLSDICAPDTQNS